MKAYFLWVGSPLHALGKLCLKSALNAGFEVTLFTDREQDFRDERLSILPYQDVYRDHVPEDIKLKGRATPYYAGFADIFRYKLLSDYDGWWFDCDTLVLKEAAVFDRLVSEKGIYVGLEDTTTINNGVIGSFGGAEMRVLYEIASAKLPNLQIWGDTGPKLLSQQIRLGHVQAHVLSKEAFYPLHFNEVEKFYHPGAQSETSRACAQSYCVSLWGEALRRTGLAYVRPPAGSFLEEYARDALSAEEWKDDSEQLVRFLSDNNHRMQALDSGRYLVKRLAEKTLSRLRRAHIWLGNSGNKNR